MELMDRLLRRKKSKAKAAPPPLPTPVRGKRAKAKPVESAPPAYQPQIEQVRNESSVPQVIGTVRIEPDQTGLVDIGPNTTGAVLLESGVLSRATPGGMANLVPVPKSEPALDTTERVPVTCGWACPWCGTYLPDYEAQLQRDHILKAHASEILIALAALHAPTAP